MKPKMPLYIFFFGLSYLLSSSLPFIRIKLGQAPIYLIDFTILVSLIGFVFWKKKFIRSDINKYIVLLIALLILGAFSLYILTGEFEFFAYRNGRRIISMSVFFISASISNDIKYGNRFLVRLMVLGVVLHASFIVGQFIISLINQELLFVIDDFYYKVLSSIDQNSRVIYWQKEWYIPRAYGGYWNPNIATAALLIPFVYVLSLKSGSKKIFAVLLSIAAMILTGSRQGIATFIVIVIFMVVFKTRSRSNKFISIPVLLLIISVLSLFLLEGVIPKSIARLFNFYENDTFSISIAGRLNNYPDFWNFMFISHPEYLLFGQGIDFYNVLLHSNIQGDTYGGGFASNSWLLFIGQQGVFAFILFVIIYIKLLKKSNNFLLAQVSLIAFGVISLFDNHIAIYESLQVIFWTIAGLVSASPPHNK